MSEWTRFYVHQRFDEDQVAKVNALDGLVLGGGGLFLPDTSPNGESGWQWNVSLSNLEAIEVPIYVIAVGYNLFEGQRFYGQTFRKSLEALVRRATIVGLRNSGSIRMVREMLPDDLKDKVRYMPCPTTILDRLTPDLPELAPPEAASRRVFLNAAFDRSERRFGDGYGAFLSRMAEFVQGLLQSGISVEIAAHLTRDEKLAVDLNQTYGIKLPIHGFYDMSCAEGYALYRQAGVVIGMRGHATMIPFGLNVPVLSIVSHPKMQYFLDDIARPGWGVRADDPALADTLFEKTMAILGDIAAARRDVLDRQEGLYEDCRKTIALIE